MEIAGLIFLLVVAAFAYIVFRLLKSTVKFAIRFLLLIVLLFAAVIGGAYIWNYEGADIHNSPVRAR
jgi:energy-coupling factor transporter transmembrane protein EcfT